MKLVTLLTDSGPTVCIDTPEGFRATPYESMQGLIESGAEGLASLRDASDRQVRVSATSFLAPLPRPGKMLFCGINYRSHLQENPSATLPDEPFFFSKLPSAVIGPDEPIVIPGPESQVDYEVELAVIVGERMRNVSREEAPTGIFGYTLVNDVSARDVQFRDNQITLGKNFDSFCPVGPCIVTADELSTPPSIKLASYVNGERLQFASTSEMLFDVAELLSYLSERLTLEPGDLVSTGTPAGVGCFLDPPRYLAPGDVVEIQADSIGRLRNPVIAGW